MDFEDLNDVVKDYLRYVGYKSTLECFETEERSKLAANKYSRKNLNIVPKVMVLKEKIEYVRSRSTKAI